MAERRPLVLVSGRVKELPAADTLPGVGGGASGVTVSDTAPVSPVEGQEWFDTTSGVQYTRIGAAWVEPGAGTITNKRTYLWT